jgi:hypothetical protein
MAQQVINVGSVGNDGNGTNWRTCWEYTNLNFTELYSTTATSTAAITANAQAIIETAALITGFTKTFWFYTENTLPAITHTAGATNTYLTNNALGAGTTQYNPDTNDAIWNPSTGKFDFTSLKIGDVVNITGRLLFDNAAAQEVDMFISAAEGTATPHEHQINHSYYKTAATGTGLTFAFPFLIKNADHKNGGARFRFASIAASSITVDSWSIVVTEV